MVTRDSSRGEWRVQSDDMAQLYRALKGAEGGIRVSLRRRVVAAARPAVAGVKEAASWSTRIPGAVKAKATFRAKGAGVVIYVDPKKAPEAAPLENHGNAGTFRRPVWADKSKDRKEWAWVDQQARPFWQRGIQGKTSAIEAEMARILDDVAREAGFK